MLAALTIAAGCADSPPSRGEQIGQSAQAVDVGGCTCVATGTCAELTYADIPADGIYYLTTFGGGTDTQAMSCRGVADATWAYAASRARFGCGAKLLIEAGGKSCVAEVADCGPNRCVEQAACNCSCANHFPVMNVSPLIAQYLLNTSSAGWSDRRPVKATRVADGTAIGCPGGPVGTGGSSGAGGAAGTGGTTGTGGVTGSGGAVGAGGSSGVGGAVGAGGSAGASGSSGAGGSGAVGGAAAAGGGAGVSGNGGSAAQSNGCSVSPDCRGCTGCMAQCTCETGDVTGCRNSCGVTSGGAAGSPATGGAGGTITAAPTTYPPIEGGICGCRAPGQPGRSPVALALLLMLPLFRWQSARRRRARVSP